MRSIEINLVGLILVVLAISSIAITLTKINSTSEIKTAETIIVENSKLSTVGKINEFNNDSIVVEINEEKTNEEIIEQTIETSAEPIEEPELEEPETIPIEEVKISKDMDLTIRTGLSRDDFIQLLTELKYDKSGFFGENAGTIYDLCATYSINEIFFCGLIAEESGWNIANNHKRTHNYISLMSNGKLISYGSVYEGLEVAAQKLHDNYLTSGGKFYHGSTLSGVKVCFCPASSTWVDATFNRMQQILY